MPETLQDGADLIVRAVPAGSEADTGTHAFEVVWEGERVGRVELLADGGDGFTVFTEGTNRTGGPEDLANLVAYLQANPGLVPPADRVAGI